MRVSMKEDETRRSGSGRGMAAAAGIVFCILVLSCVSVVDGATDPGDGAVPSLSRFVCSFCTSYGGVGNGYLS
jgi:hypothetical protein